MVARLPLLLRTARATSTIRKQPRQWRPYLFWFRISARGAATMKWEDAAMRLLLISLGVFALVSFAVCPFTATAAGSAGVRAKCQEK